MLCFWAGKLWAQRCVGTVDAVDEEPEAAKMRVRFYKVRPMAPFLDVNVQDSRLRHRKRVVFAARDVLLLTVELCKVELCPMLVPFVGRRLFFYRVAILHCPFFSGGVPWCVELVADRW